MPYCQECGSYLEQDINTCSSCGNKLVDVLPDKASPAKEETESESLKTDEDTLSPSNFAEKSQEIAESPEGAIESSKEHQPSSNPEPNSAFNGIQTEFKPQEGIGLGSHWNHIESHLGKGLIKPVAIENCLDGYHFKYDEAPRQIIRPEPQQEKVVEFRFSGEPEPTEEAKEIQEAVEVEKANQEISDAAEGDLNQDELQAETEQVGKLGTDSDSELSDPVEDNPEQAAPVEENGLLEDDLVPEISAPEPEIRAAVEPEILWEGHRSWYGLALKERYRITDQSLMLLCDGQILKEIEWRSVSEIVLKQNWLAKLLYIGNLEIMGAISEPLLILEGIDHPEELQKTLVEMVSSKV